MPIVELSNGERIDFPDSMSDDEIKATILRKYPIGKKGGAGRSWEDEEAPKAYNPIPSPVDVASSLLPKEPSEVGGMAGGTAGSALGAMTGIPGVKYAGGIAGAGIGGAAGKLFDIVEHQAQNLGRKMVSSVTGQSLPPAAPGLMHDIGDIPGAAERSMMGQAIGVPAANTVNFMLGPLAKRTTPALNTDPAKAAEAAARQAQIQDWERRGQTYTTGQATQQPLVAALEGGLTHVPSTTSYATDVIQSQLRARRDSLIDWVRQVNPQAVKDLDLAGGQAAQQAKASYDAARQASSSAYDVAYAVTGGQQFDMTPVQNTIAQLTQGSGAATLAGPSVSKSTSLLLEMIEDAKERAGNIPVPIGSTGVTIALKDLPSHLQDFVKNDPALLALIRATSQPATDTRTMNQAYSGLMKIVRTAGKSPRFSNADGRAAAVIASSLSDRMHDISKDPQYAAFAPLWDAARDTHRTMVGEAFKDPDVIQRLWGYSKQGERDKIAKMIFESGSIGPVRAMQRAIGKDETRKFAASWMYHTIEADSVANGEFSSDRFSTMFEPKNYPRDWLKETFGNNHGTDLGTILDGFDAIKRAKIGGENPSKTARSLMMYHQIITAGTAALGIFTGHWGPAAAAVTTLYAIPQAAARILMSPTGAKWMAGAFRPGLTNQQLIDIGVRTATIAQFPHESETPTPTDDDIKAEKTPAPFATAAFPR